MLDEYDISCAHNIITGAFRPISHNNLEMVQNRDMVITKG